MSHARGRQQPLPHLSFHKAGVSIRIAFVTSHPIQYQVPVFRCLTQTPGIDLTVLYAMLPDSATQGAGFGVSFEWDIPLLEGYNYRVLKNVSANPGVTHFGGCDTPEIADVLKELKIEAVVVNGWVVKTCLQALRAAKKLRVPCIVRGEANNLRKRPLWKRLPQRLLVRKYDAVLPIGKASREFYRSHGVSESKMFDARYCVENQRFARAANEAEPRRSTLRSQWGIPENAVCFLYCGKFEQKKHPVELVEAFLQAHQQSMDSEQNTQIHLLMVGDGELRGECEKRVAAHEALGARGEGRGELTPRSSLLAPRPPVTFTGFLNQSQIVDAYVASDVLALPSDAGETWGLVVNEAMACGRPAIVSHLVGCGEDLIQPDETGWVFRFGDWSSLSELMLSVSRNPHHLASMRQNCLQRISEYSPEAAARGIESAAFSVLRSRSETATRPPISSK